MRSLQLRGMLDTVPAAPPFTTTSAVAVKVSAAGLKANVVKVRFAAHVLAMLAHAAALPVQAADPQTPNCNVDGIATPCFEEVWVDGDQVKMTFIDLDPTPFSPSDVNFYVLAPQTATPQQGPVPFFHDHVNLRIAAGIVLSSLLNHGDIKRDAVVG
jgi:hypothetical protein